MEDSVKELKKTDWYKTRPSAVKKAVDLWHGRRIEIEGKIAYVIGFTETDESRESDNPNDLMLILSFTNPAVNFDKARSEIFRVCAKHFIPYHPNKDTWTGPIQ